MSKTIQQKVGNFGEELACKHLIMKGYKIIDRNVKVSYYEIDIIAKIKGILVFVEVKTRLNPVFDSADDLMNKNKLKMLKKGIKYYLYLNKKSVDSFTCDLISIDMFKSTKTAKIKHYKNIF